MNLRTLEQKDAPLMLEWMHDDSLVQDMKKNFSEKNLEDCRRFIEKAQDTEHDLHLAITDEYDTYMGTVSLKHIENSLAEFGIAVRRTAQGKGYARWGMKEILKLGFQKYGLKNIYWCVMPTNARAIRFYDKNGYVRANNEGKLRKLLPGMRGGYSSGEINNYIWYIADNKSCG